MYAPAASPAHGHERAVRTERHHQKKVAAIAAMETHSLSKPPPTLRAKWAGRIAIVAAAAAPEATLQPAASYASMPVWRLAMTPNQTGTKAQTSLRLMLPPAAAIAFQSTTAEICMPG